MFTRTDTRDRMHCSLALQTSIDPLYEYSMGLFRILVVVMVTLSASVSGTMDAGHAAALEHSHAAMDEMAGDQPVCCSQSSEGPQSCHVLPALLPYSDLHHAAPASCEDVPIGAGLLLTGIEPSGPLDPPDPV